MKKRMEEKLEHEGRENDPYAGLPEHRKSQILSAVASELSSFELKVFEKYLDGMKAKEISAELSADGSIKCSCSEKSVNNAIYRTKVKVKRVYWEKFLNNF